MTTYSCHYFMDEGFRKAIKEFLVRESSQESHPESSARVPEIVIPQSFVVRKSLNFKISSLLQLMTLQMFMQRLKYQALKRLLSRTCLS